MNIDNLLGHPAWHLLTRLGEAQILLPAALLTVAALLLRPAARPLAAWWMGLLAAAVLLTTVSKIAFIGWGIGSSALDFTGISGHAMFAAAVYPLLFGALASNAGRAGRVAAIALGTALALAIGVSRVAVNAHSVSEVLAGLLVGGVASAAAFASARLPRGLIGPLLPVAIAAWLALMPWHAPPSETHGLVTALSLKLSGHARPYTRADLRREALRESRLKREPRQPGQGRVLQQHDRLAVLDPA